MMQTPPLLHSPASDHAEKTMDGRPDDDGQIYEIEMEMEVEMEIEK
jgi:hypothetical protein